MEDLALYSTEKVHYSYEIGGLGTRFIGLLVDTLIIIAVYAVFALLLFVLYTTGIFDHMSDIVIAVIAAVSILIIFLTGFGYFIFFETVWNGQTPGKKAAGIRVVRKTGEAVTFTNVLVRNILRIIDALPAYTVGMLAILFSKNQQRLGDMLAETVVIRERKFSSPQLFDNSVIDMVLADKVRPGIYEI